MRENILMKDIPKEIQKIKEPWEKRKNTGRMIHYGFGIVGVLCSVSAASVFLGIINRLILLTARYCMKGN